MKKKFILLTGLVALLCIEKALPQHIKADTARASKSDRGPFEAEKLVNLLTGEGYHFLMPNSIGIRVINNGNNSGSFYSGLKWDKTKNFNSFIIPDHAQVEICAVLTDEKNADNFRYHIVQNDERELIPWTKPTVFKSTRIGKLRYCYLGKFDYSPLQLLKVKMYDVNDRYNRYTIYIDWRKIQKSSFLGVIQYISSSFPRGPGWGLQERGLYDTIKTRQPYYNRKTGKPILVPYKDFIETTPLQDKNSFPTEIKFRLGDSLQNISFKNISYFDYRANGTNGKTYDFKVSLERKAGGHADTINLGNATANFELNKEFWKYPGKYLLTIVPDLTSPDGSAITIPGNLIQTISFTVLPAINVEQKVPLRTVAFIILIILTTVGFMFMMYRDQQKRKLKREAQNKQIATLQLQAVRSQLNPHFIFNALAGIQNLMNKNEVENANKYLSRFARLTRNILDDSNKELISIEQEIGLLNDYLQMEQMRFGFQYKILVDSDRIDQQAEIPAMLLQPFVENAVKHGVSALKDAGMITIAITKKENDLVLTVQDNGKGFNETQSTGMGMKLCQDRIALLNSIYKNTTILLYKTSGDRRTIITIELKNWI